MPSENSPFQIGHHHPYHAAHLVSASTSDSVSFACIINACIIIFKKTLLVSVQNVSVVPSHLKEPMDLNCKPSNSDCRCVCTVPTIAVSYYFSYLSFSLSFSSINVFFRTRHILGTVTEKCFQLLISVNNAVWSAAFTVLNV